MLGSRGLKAWCRPYPIETTGEITKFDFDMKSGKFELSIKVPKTTEAGEGYTKLYLPYAHYLASNPPSTVDPKSATHRILGEPDEEGSEWVKGRGEARVDLEITELSVGTLDIRGQWGYWRYPLEPNAEVEIRLILKPWKA